MVNADSSRNALTDICPCYNPTRYNRAGAKGEQIFLRSLTLVGLSVYYRQEAPNGAKPPHIVIRNS